jgi:hypothetical protein
MNCWTNAASLTGSSLEADPEAEGFLPGLTIFVKKVALPEWRCQASRHAFFVVRCTFVDCRSLSLNAPGMPVGSTTGKTAEIAIAMSPTMISPRPRGLSDAALFTAPTLRPVRRR